MRATSVPTWVTIGCAAFLAVSGCGSEDTAPEEPEAYAQVHVDPGGATSPESAQPGQTEIPTDPEAVMVAAAEELFTWFPVSDANRGQATVRASDYLVPDLVHANDDINADAQWRQWAADGISISATATISPENHPPDSDTSVSRAVVVEQRQTSPSGSSDLDASTVFMTVEKQKDQSWKVAKYSLG